jgi:hypothetical protein
MDHMRIRALTVLATLLLAVSVPAGAQAAPPVEHIHGEEAETGSFEECGLTIEFDFTVTFHDVLREVPGSDGQAFLGHSNFKFRNVLTNAATGEWFVIRGHGLFKEMTARHVEGDIWEFTAHEAGQPFVVEDSDGNVVLRDRGLITRRVLFDTLGDHQPGGIVLEEEITGIHGPHPGLDPAAFCAIVTDLIG